VRVAIERYSGFPPAASLPSEYATTLREIKNRVSKARIYWDIGQIILARQGEEGRGAKVIDRLSFGLREAFPDMDGLSSRTLKYMVSAARTPSSELTTA